MKMNKKIRLAIHHREGSFSDRWIEYCDNQKINYKLVNCYQSDIVDQLYDCDGLMWHWHHADPKAVSFARQLTYALEASGKKVFPSATTCWHFDDKVGQKYLFEAIGAPLIPSYVFYDKQTALRFIEETTFPKVFKLRGGSGSSNVKLVRKKTEARKLVHKAFGRGLTKIDRFSLFKDRFWHLQRDRNIKAIWGCFKGLARVLVPTKYEISAGRDKGYVYFQDFIPDNSFDIRVIVIGQRAFAIKRMVRDGDFRASGSGMSVHDHCQIPLDCVRIAFDTSRKLGAQCLSFDFVLDGSSYQIIEMSYGFVTKVYAGYWDLDLKWHSGQFVAPYFMVEYFLESLR
jgi:hypothetical protein